MADQQQHADDDLKHKLRLASWVRLALALLLLIPIIVLFFLPSGPLLASVFWFWLLLLLTFWLVWMFFGQEFIDWYVALVTPA